MIDEILQKTLGKGLDPEKKYIYYKNYNLLRIFYSDWYEEMQKKLDRIKYLKIRWKIYDQKNDISSKLKYINDQIQKLDDLVNWIKAEEGKAKK